MEQPRTDQSSTNSQGNSAPGGVQSIEYTPLVPIEAEKALLGCLLTDEGICQEYSQVLTPDHFGDARNRYLMRVIKAMVASGIHPDIATISTFMGGPGKLAGLGGMSHLTDLYDTLSHVNRVGDYAEQVRQAASVRRVTDAGRALIKLGDVDSTDKESLAVMVKSAESLIMSLGDAQGKSNSSDLDELTEEYFLRMAATKEDSKSAWGIDTGIELFTNMIRGIKAPDLIIIGARPSAGKTTLVSCIASHVAIKENEPVIVFTMEMNRHQIYNRLVVNASQTSRHDIEEGKIPADKYAGFVESIERMRPSPMYINDKARVTPAYIRSETLRYQARIGRPVKLVVVDYLQRMEGNGKKNPNRVQELSQIAIDLKTLATELNVCVLVTAQVGHHVETRENKRPMMSDLKDCGSIEQEADVVAFIYRESYYAMKDLTEVERLSREMLQEEVEVIFEKNRDGRTGTIKLGYTAALSSFEDLPDESSADFDGRIPL